MECKPGSAITTDTRTSPTSAGFESNAPDERTSLASDWVFLGTSLVLFLASVGGKIYFSMRSMPGGMSISGQTWREVAGSFIGTWLRMMMAMMLPSLVPTLVRYRRDLRRFSEKSLTDLTMFAGTSYFLVWAGFGALAYLFGILWGTAEMHWMVLSSLPPIATGLVLLLAGCLQLTSWKAHQLECCCDSAAWAHSPFTPSEGAWQ